MGKHTEHDRKTIGKSWENHSKIIGIHGKILETYGKDNYKLRFIAGNSIYNLVDFPASHGDDDLISRNFSTFLVHSPIQCTQIHLVELPACGKD